MPQIISPPVPEFIDPAFAKTSPKRSFCVTENERFRLVFAKTGSINSGTEEYLNHSGIYAVYALPDLYNYPFIT